jgi:hypothetical protein
MWKYFVLELKTIGGWCPIKVIKSPSIYPLLESYGSNLSVRVKRRPDEEAEQLAIERKLDIDHWL